MKLNVTKINAAYASNAKLAALVATMSDFYSTLSEIRKHAKARGGIIETRNTHGIAIRNKNGTLVGEFWFDTNIGRICK